MDNPSTIDPSLLFTPSEATINYFTQHDFDLSDTFPSDDTSQTQNSYIHTYLSSPLTSLSNRSPQETMNYTFASPDTSYESSFEEPLTPTPKPHNSRSTPRGKQKGEQKTKRHQTKIACIWCRKLNKKCDAQRPCGRCNRFKRCAECVDAPPRKPRHCQNRGPYKKDKREGKHGHEGDGRGERGETERRRGRSRFLIEEMEEEALRGMGQGTAGEEVSLFHGMDGADISLASADDSPSPPWDQTPLFVDSFDISVSEPWSEITPFPAIDGTVTEATETLRKHSHTLDFQEDQLRWMEEFLD